MVKKTIIILLLFINCPLFGQLLKHENLYFNFTVRDFLGVDTIKAQYYSYSYSNDTLIDLYGNDATFSGDTITFPNSLSIFNKADTNIWHTSLLDTFNNAYQWLWSELQNAYTLPRMKGIDNCFRLFVGGDSIKNSKILLFSTSKEDEYHRWLNLTETDYPFLYFRDDTTYDAATNFADFTFWDDTSKVYIFWDDGDIDTILNGEGTRSHTYADKSLQPYIKFVGDLHRMKKLRVEQTGGVGHTNDANIELYENCDAIEYMYMYRIGHHGNVYYMRNNDSIINFYLDNTVNYLGEKIYGDVSYVSSLLRLEDFVISETHLSDTIEFADISNIYWIHLIGADYAAFDLDSIQYLTRIIEHNDPQFYFNIYQSASYGDIVNYQYFDSTGFDGGVAQIRLDDMSLIYGNIGVFSKFTGLKIFKCDGSENLTGDLDTLINNLWSSLNQIDLNTQINFDLGNLATCDSIKRFDAQINKNGIYTSPGAWGWNNIHIGIYDCDFVTADIDQLLIDLDADGATNGYLDIQKNGARSATSNTAYNNLISKNWTINE